MILDHLALCAQTLAQGEEYVRDCLGVPLSGGGEHPLMGTHNKLLSLGSSTYLEVIAINPDAKPLDHPRWFDLDNFTGKPRLTNWIARCDDLAKAIAAAPVGIGRETALSRGNLRWCMAVPDDGKLPFDGMYPALIRWDSDVHPAAQLPDRGCRLEGLEFGHPRATELTRALGPDLLASVTQVSAAASPGITARIMTADGLRRLA